MERAHTQRIARKPQDAPGEPQCSPKREVCHCKSKVASQGVLVARFEIPYPTTKRGMTAWNKRFGVNAYYSGKHYQARKRDADELHQIALTCMRRAKIRRHFVSYPVDVRFFWDDRLDVDNHAVMGKAFVDAMKGYILPDDNRRWLKRVSHEFWDEGKIGVEIWRYE